MSSQVAAHTRVAMVQRRVTKVPAATPVMVVVAEFGLVIVTAGPPTWLQVPVPTTGTLAFMAKVLLAHCSIAGTPASAAVGVAKLVSTTSSVVPAQVPLSTAQRRVTEVPAATPVTVVVANEGSVIVTAGPPTWLHVPVPTAGATAALGQCLSLHFCWSMPASAAE